MDKNLVYYNENERDLRVEVKNIITDVDLNQFVGCSGCVVGEDKGMEDAYIVRFDNGSENVFFKEELQVIF